MKIKELIEALQKWDGDKEVSIWFGEQEGLKVVEVNEPGQRVDGPIIWVAL